MSKAGSGVLRSLRISRGWSARGGLFDVDSLCVAVSRSALESERPVSVGWFVGPKFFVMFPSSPLLGGAGAC